MKRRLNIIAILMISSAVFALEPGQKEHYHRWLGCPAPEITFDSSDTTEHALPSYQGKKVLLYGFYSGAFAIGRYDPPIEASIRPLGFLSKASESAEHPFATIGYSRGFALAKHGMIEIPAEIFDLVAFPVVNLNNKHGDHSLPEPFDLLHKPGTGILIDTNGVICRMYFPMMGEADFQDAANAEPWQGPVRSPPETAWRNLPRALVVAAARNLHAGEVLDIRAVGTIRMLKGLVPEGTISPDDAAKFIGSIITADLKFRQPITKDMLIENEGAPTR